MINLNKKMVMLNGLVAFPLKIGNKATVFHDGGTLRTSAVVEIRQVDFGSIVFETQNTNYCVITQKKPAPSAHSASAADMVRSSIATRPQVEFTHLRCSAFYR